MAWVEATEASFSSLDETRKECARSRDEIDEFMLGKHMKITDENGKRTVTGKKKERKRQNGLENEEESEEREKIEKKKKWEQVS